MSVHVRGPQRSASPGTSVNPGTDGPIPSPHCIHRTADVQQSSADASPEKTSSVNSVGAYYPWLDVVRGCSWIMVMISHSVGGVGYLGRMGVGLFFATSGWLITTIIIGQTEAKWSLTKFYTRRCLRILPLYYVLIVGACLFSYFFPLWSTHFVFLPPARPEQTMLAYLTTFSTEFWRGGGGGFLIGHCWSLCVEERFYVFWPLLLTLWPRNVNARRTLIVLMIATWSMALYRLPLADVSTALWAVPFPLLMGCALALFVPKARLPLSIKVTLPLALFLFWGYLSFASHQESRSATTGTFSLLAGLLAMGIVACAVSTVGQPRNWIGRLLQECGKLSYAAYLFHPLFAFIAMATATKIGVRWSAPFMGVAMVLPIAFATHRWIEQPILLRRQAVEKSPLWRYLCACLQVVPIGIGLMMFFPWHDLAAKIRLLPNLMWILAALVAFAVGTRVFCLTRKRCQEPLPVVPVPLLGP